jgi:outer membrane protein TolC
LEANQAASHAELDLCDTDKERLAVLEKMLAEAKGFEASVAERVKAGESPIRAVLQAKVSRLEIEIALEHVKGK